MTGARVGNDIVDLENPRVRGKERDERFLARIFTPEERAVIASSRDPALELWGMWAAKEAAFKIVSKARPEPPPFEHAAFVVAWSEAERTACPYGPVVRAGTVRHAESEVRVEVTADAARLTALAREPGLSPARIRGAVLELGGPDAAWARDEAALRERLSPRELEPVHSAASAAVRVGAREALAHAWGVDTARLEIVCDPGPTGRRPPRVHLDGAASAADVSLSHDGRWIAWAYLVPEP